jgi:hypothetical protein
VLQIHSVLFGGPFVRKLALQLTPVLKLCNILLHGMRVGRSLCVKL